MYLPIKFLRILLALAIRPSANKLNSTNRSSLSSIKYLATLRLSTSFNKNGSAYNISFNSSILITVCTSP